MTFSPDGAWVASAPPWAPAELTLIATGSDQHRTLPLDGIERIHIPLWSPDGGSILFTGNAPGEQNRVFRVDLEGNDTTPLTEEGLRFGTHTLSQLLVVSGLE